MTWDIALVIGMNGLSFGLFYLASILDEKHYPAKLLFILMGLFNYLGLSSMFSKIVEEASLGVSIIGITDRVYIGFLWTVLLATAYFMLNFLWEAMMALRARYYEKEKA